MGIDQAIEDWGPACIEKIAVIRQKIAQLENKETGHDAILQALDSLEQTYLKPGFQDVLRALVPRDKVVFSHNDA